MKYARVVNGIAVDVVDSDPIKLFTPSIAQEFIEAPDNIEHQWKFDGLNWSEPDEIIQPEQPIKYNIMSPIEYKLMFTIQERLAIKTESETDPIIADILEIINDPRGKFVDMNIKGNRDTIDYFISKGIINEDRRDHFLTGSVYD